MTPTSIKRCEKNLLSCVSEPCSTPFLWKLSRQKEAFINEVPATTWKRVLTFRLRKWKELQPSTEGVDRRARRSYRYRGWGHKTWLAVSVLAPGASVLPIKLRGSCGCNEVVGTKVAITAQLNCHQRLMKSQDKTLIYLQIEAQLLCRHAVAFVAGVYVGWNIFFFLIYISVFIVQTSCLAVESCVSVTWHVWRKHLWC